MNEEPRHGIDGWVLVAYSWSFSDEIGRFAYERGKEAKMVARHQPRVARGNWRGCAPT